MNTKEIRRMLDGLASGIRDVGPERWTFGLDNGNGGDGLEVSARLTEGWLMLAAPLENGGRALAPWELLSRNAALEGLGKFTLRIGDERPLLQAEIPVDGESQTTLLLEQTCRGLGNAFEDGKDRDAKKKPERETVSRTPSTPETGDGSLAKLVKAAGWPFIEREEGRAAVQLEAGNMFYQAALEEGGDGELHAWVKVADSGGFSEGSRQALAVLLLTASGVIRLVRAAAEQQEEHCEGRFEVRFGQQPTATQLDHALSALSVACLLCGREAGAMTDAVVADRYLACQGRPSLKKAGTKSLNAN